MSTEFGDSEFVVGSIFGERGWTVDIDGVLGSPSRSRVKWTGGEMSAECDAYTIPPASRPEEYELMDREEQRAAYGRWKGNHGLDECEHGFYAYYQDKSDGYYYSNEPVIVGIIEGYGDTIVGTKGFRCSKAKIVALSLQHRGPWELSERVRELIEVNYGVPVFRTDMAMRREFSITSAAQISDLLEGARHD